MAFENQSRNRGGSKMWMGMISLAFAAFTTTIILRGKYGRRRPDGIIVRFDSNLPPDEATFSHCRMTRGFV